MIYDISHWQKGINFDTMVAYDEHVKFIMQCGYGSDYRTQDDELFLGNFPALYAQGRVFGCYLYNYGTTTPQLQSEVAHIARLLPPEKYAHLPIFLDIEENNSIAVASSIVHAFYNEMYRLGYVRPGIYASESVWNSSIAPAAAARGLKWVANWNYEPGVPWDLWQYTSNSHSEGYNGRLDANRVNTKGDLWEWTKFQKEEPSTDELARRVIRGDFGNGQDRKDALGARYDIVQARVNEMLGAAESPANNNTIDELARRAIRGDFGNGQARKDALGAQYDIVQARVNEMLNNEGVYTPSTDELARRAIRGDFGNGQARKDALGARYAEVQARVNEILG